MKTTKLERLQAAGWNVGRTEDFLSLSDEEAKLVALKVSQNDLAQRTKSSQSWNATRQLVPAGRRQ